jgi:hypothetical protein
VEKCQVTITGGQIAIDAAGGTGALSVSAQAECGWTAEAAVSWISGLSPASGQGNGEIKFQVAPNPTSAARQAEISLNGSAVKVTQAGASCQVEITPARQTVPVGGGSGTVNVMTSLGCPWTVTSNASWLTATAGGTGTGTVTFSAAANDGPARTGELTIGNQIFVVAQPAQPAPGAAECTYTLQPDALSIDAAGGRTTVSVHTAADCSWAASSSAAWLIVEGTGTGTGSASLTLRASPNTGAQRSASVLVDEQTLIVTQDGGCVTTIGSTSQTMPAIGGIATPVTVEAPPACQWTTTTTAAWITITSGTKGSGNGTVGYTVAVNTGAARTGTIRIATNTFTVAQEAACSYSIDPTDQSFGQKPSTSDPVAVTTQAGCTWAAVSNDDWISVKTGSSGTGSGTVTFTISRNNGDDTRVGTLTIAGRTFTVTQDY